MSTLPSLRIPSRKAEAAWKATVAPATGPAVRDRRDRSQLASTGLRLDSLHEIAAASPSLRTMPPRRLFMAGVAARAWGPVLWVVRRRDLFAPGLYQAGLAPERADLCRGGRTMPSCSR